jgi:predicted AAA+ superfamily ATPase
LAITQNRESHEREFEKYINCGGLAEAINLANKDIALSRSYVLQVYNSIYQNDISRRQNIYHHEKYRKVVEFLCDTIGSEISITNIANALSQNSAEIDKNTVSKYVQTLTNCYLFYMTKRFNIKGKNILKTGQKYYLVDVAFRNVLLGKDAKFDKGHIVENTVYLELLRRDNTVMIGKVKDAEVDFVAVDKHGFTKYYQVALTVMDQKTLARELKPLNGIKDHNEKLLLTLDYGEYSHNGIRQVNLIDWLLGR